MPPKEITPTSVVPPPMSTTIEPEASDTGKPAPIAAAMGSSIKYTSEAPAPKADTSPDPEGPVQQLDVPEGEIPIGQDGASLTIDGTGVTLKQEGVPVEVRVGEGGVVVQPSAAPTPPP